MKTPTDLSKVLFVKEMLATTAEYTEAGVDGVQLGMAIHLIGSMGADPTPVVVLAVFPDTVAGGLDHLTAAVYHQRAQLAAEDSGMKWRPTSW